MQQIWITKAGEPKVLQLREAALPVPTSGEVRIMVEAAGINFADLLGRMGLYRPSPGIPYVPGFEVAGTIDAVGQGVSGFKEGDKVFAITRFGGYCNVVCVPFRQVFKRLEWMNALDGAAIPVNYLTAYVMLIVMGSLHASDTVLIHNVGSGVGLAALQISGLIGAKAYGTASPHKHSALRELGLDNPIDYVNEDYERVIGKLTGQRGVDIVLDPLGGRDWKKNYRLLAPTGRLISYGMSNIAKGNKRSMLRLLHTLLTVPFHTPLGLMNDNKGVIGVNISNLWGELTMLGKWMQQITSWYDEALFRPTIDKTFPFNQAAEAHAYIHERKNVGKVLLIP